MSIDTEVAFERVPDTIGAFRWDGDRRVVSLDRGELRGLVRDLERGAQDEAVYQVDLMGRHGVKATPKEVYRLLVPSTLRSDHRFVLGELQVDEETSTVMGLSPRAEVVVNLKDATVCWASLTAARERRVREQNERFSGSWLGKPLYEWVVSAILREKGRR